MRLKGKGAVVHRVGFGEMVLDRRKSVQNKLSKLTPLWEGGVYSGIRTASDEQIVSMPEGTARCSAGRGGGRGSRAAELVGEFNGIRRMMTRAWTDHQIMLSRGRK